MVDFESSCKYRVYSVYGPSRAGKMLFYLESAWIVTMEFPSYGLEEVEYDIRVQTKLEGGNKLMEVIPKLPIFCR